ncbi:MAG: AI-2E family transporter [Pseudothermotoga sp.]|uniref:AI-2E family transporter n=1 Tax=Pseudothermotoga sp. TaxID=2033661 RepID=UPI0019A7A995|nr:AI-2E family transporter [Pseudothermotoga sp.]
MKERNAALYYTLLYTAIVVFLWVVFKPFFQICLFSFILVMVVDAIASLLKKFFRLTRKRVATILALVLFFFLFGWALVEILPKAVTELADFYNLVAKVIREKAWQQYLTGNESVVNVLNDLADFLEPYLDKLLEFVLKWIAANAPSFFVVTFFTILCGVYASFYAGAIARFIPNLYPATCRNFVNGFVDDFKVSMRRFIGVLTLNAIIVGLAFGVLFAFLSPRYAPLIGIWAFVTNLIPIVGVPLELVPILLFSLTLGLRTLLWVFIFAFIVHLFVFVLFFEVTKTTMRVNPVLMILSIVLGGMLFGFAGVFVGAPMAAYATIFYKHFLKARFEET